MLGKQNVSLISVSPIYPNRSQSVRAQQMNHHVTHNNEPEPPNLTNPRRVKKLTKFFGEDPPLMRLFLKNLGYEVYTFVNNYFVHFVANNLLLLSEIREPFRSGTRWHDRTAVPGRRAPAETRRATWAATSYSARSTNLLVQRHNAMHSLDLDAT